MGAVVCAAVVGPGNNPLYVKALAPVEDEVKFHYMVHASLDAVEEKVRVDVWFGCVGWGCCCVVCCGG